MGAGAAVFRSGQENGYRKERSCATGLRTRTWPASEIPAVNGHGAARSVAEIGCILANGGVAKGKRWMSEAGCRKALEKLIEGPDLVMSHLPPARFGMGFALPGPSLDLELPDPHTIH